MTKVQLTEALGLTSHLPNDLKPIFQALFEYGNRMFHCGFEWPVHERRSFENRIAEAGWPSEWFALKAWYTAWYTIVMSKTVLQ